MQAIILAAGEGTRLRPYTNLIPKPLLTISGMPLITYQIEKLNNLGIENKEIIVVVRYLKEEIIGYLNRFHKEVKIIEQSTEKNGTSAAVESAKKYVKNNDILIIYGDVFFEDDLKDFIKYEYSIAVYEVDDVSKFGKVIRENGYLKDIKEKSESGKGEIFAGIVKVKKDFFNILSSVKPNMKNGEYYLTDAILLQNIKTPFVVYRLKGYWFDIGNEESLVAARKYANKNF